MKKAAQVSYSVDDYNVLHVYLGDRLLCDIQDVTSDRQARRLVDEELARLKD